jgi:hypothetical protein
MRRHEPLVCYRINRQLSLQRRRRSTEVKSMIVGLLRAAASKQLRAGAGGYIRICEIDCLPGVVRLELANVDSS